MEEKYLVLIHLQPGIVEWGPLALLDRVKVLVNDYIRQGYPIFVLELEGYPPTCAWLDSLLRGYAKFHCLRSEFTDGSLAISQAIGQLALTADGVKIEVGGLFSYACVFDTVAGLSGRLSGAEITVIESACDDYLDGDWSAFQSLASVSLS